MTAPCDETLRQLTAEEPSGFPDDATRDAIVGDWYLYQRKGGHRTSTDDVLAAWFAALHTRSPVARYVDLGCGIGSVFLLTAHALRPGLAHGVEAQSQSATMAARTVRELPGAAADAMGMRIHHGDFRSFRPDERYDLVTGSPPYFPVGTGVLPHDSQRRACRFELRGGVEGYCDTAARVMRPGGAFSLVFQTTWDERVIAAADEAGLHLRGRCDVLMREDRPRPFLSVYRFAHEPGDVDVHPPFAIRTASGSVSAEYAHARAILGLATTG